QTRRDYPTDWQQSTLPMEPYGHFCPVLRLLCSTGSNTRVTPPCRVRNWLCLHFAGPDRNISLDRRLRTPPPTSPRPACDGRYPTCESRSSLPAFDKYFPWWKESGSALLFSWRC